MYTAYTYTALHVQRSSAHKIKWLLLGCVDVAAACTQYTAHTAYSIHSMYTAQHVHSMYTAQHVHSMYTAYTACTQHTRTLHCMYSDPRHTEWLLLGCVAVAACAGCVGLGLVGNSLDLCRPSLWYFKLLHNFYINTLFDKWPNESWLFHSCFPVIKSLKLH